MGLKEGVDFKTSVDISEYYSSMNPRYGNRSYHSLQHEAKVLLGNTTSEQHDPRQDAKDSIALYQLWESADSNRRKMMQRQLRDTRPEPSFAKKNGWIPLQGCVYGKVYATLVHMWTATKLKSEVPG